MWSCTPGQRLWQRGSSQEQTLFEVPKDKQAGNPYILSLGFIHRHLEKCVEITSTDTGSVQSGYWATGSHSPLCTSFPTLMALRHQPITTASFYWVQLETYIVCSAPSLSHHFLLVLSWLLSIFLKSLLWKRPFEDMSCAISYQVIMFMFFCDFHGSQEYANTWFANKIFYGWITEKIWRWLIGQ